MSGSRSFDVAPRQVRYIRTLDGWRAVAISIVMLQHTSEQLERAVGSWISPVTDIFHEHGRFGVFIFFAISGFLITSLLADELGVAGRIDLRSFYVRRAFRILPPLLVVLGVFGVLGITGVIPIPLGKWLGSLLFVQNYTPGGSWYLGHFWSLSIEEQFYLFWPVALALLGTRRGLKLCVGLIAAVCAWRLVDLSWGLTAGWRLNYIDRTDTQVDGLLWGAVFALLWRQPQVPALVATLTRGIRYWCIAIVLIATQAVAPTQPALQALQLAVRPLLVAVLVVGTVAAPGRPWSRLLETPPMRYVGRISYSLYLWQQLFLVWDAFASPRLEAVQRFPVNIACAFAMAVLSHRFIERPTMAYGRRLAARLRREHDDQTSDRNTTAMLR